MNSDALIIAFIQGAKWWEYHQKGATAWGSDQKLMANEAEKKLKDGTLGKAFEDRLKTKEGV